MSGHFIMRSPAQTGRCPPPPRKRGRPPVISTDELLAVAREVFLTRGIRATTAEVAERARVSEGVLFHRFRSKDALFRAAMRFDPEEVPEPMAALASRVGEHDLRAVLVDVATRMLDIGRISLPVMMMSWSNPAGDYALEKIATKRPHGYGEALASLVSFFEGEMKGGRLRPQDPEVIARMFIGSLHHYCMTELFGLLDTSRLPPRAFAESLVDTLLRASTPEGRS
jgi:AcrR family transcriptional regulator